MVECSEGCVTTTEHASSDILNFHHIWLTLVGTGPTHNSYVVFISVKRELPQCTLHNYFIFLEFASFRQIILFITVNTVSMCASQLIAYDMIPGFLLLLSFYKSVQQLIPRFRQEILLKCQNIFYSLLILLMSSKICDDLLRLCTWNVTLTAVAHQDLDLRFQSKCN